MERRVIMVKEEDGDYNQKMRRAQEQWEEVPVEVQEPVEALFNQATEKGYELEEYEREWRRVGVAHAMMDFDEKDNELSSVTKTGLKVFPPFTGDVSWEECLDDFNELVEAYRPESLRIRLLRQAVGPEAKRSLDAYLMPAGLYTDFEEYTDRAADILGPAGGDWQIRRQAARCIQRTGE